MKFILTKDYEEMSKVAAEIVIKQIKQKPDSLICFPTGSTPLRMYELLVEANQAQAVDFSLVRVMSVDEYWGLSPLHHQSYAYFLHQHLFDKINIKKENIALIDGRWQKVEEEIEAYQKKQAEWGGIDLYIDGVGANGHIGFNEPAESLLLDYHLQDIAYETRLANARFFTDNLDEVPKQAISIGVNNILQARNILFISNGEHKAEAWRIYSADNAVTTAFPLSFLKLAGDNAVAVIDQASAKYFKQS